MRIRRTMRLQRCGVVFFLFMLSGLGISGCLRNSVQRPASLDPSAENDSEIRPLRYELNLALNPDSETFQGTVRITFHRSEGSTRIAVNAKDLEIREAFLHRRGETVVLTIPKAENELLVFAGPPASKEPETVTIRYSGPLPLAEAAGLFRRNTRGRNFIFSQFEAEDARRAFPCLDIPKWKTPFQLTVEAPPDVEVLSNTEPLETIRHESSVITRFAETKPLPTYLVAVAAGHFDRIDAGTTRAGKPIRIIAPKGAAAEAGESRPLVQPIVRAIEEYFEIDYPFSKLDLIAVPTFPGAMENPGLIVFNERLLLWPKEQSADRKQMDLADVGAHEVAHQWFGNYLTLDSWQDVWLNEGFATWLGTSIATELFPQWERAISNFQYFLDAVFQDRLGSARRIREPASGRGGVMNAFDGIAYQKTAALLAMFEHFYGKERFRSFIHSYVAAQPFGSTNAGRFLSALEQAFGPTARRSFETFLDQRGAPVLSARLDCEQKRELLIGQSRFVPIGGSGAVNAAWTIPVCFRFGYGSETVSHCQFIGPPPADTIPLPDARCPDWLMGNGDGAGYYLFDTDAKSFGKMLQSGFWKLSRFERLTVLRDVRAAVGNGALPVGELFRFLPRLTADRTRILREPELFAQLASISRLREGFFRKQLEPGYRRFLSSVFQPILKQLGEPTSPAPGEGAAVERLRTELLQLSVYQLKDPGLTRLAEGLLRTWLENPGSVPRHLRAFTLSNGLSGKNEALHDTVLARLRKVPEQSMRSDLVSILASSGKERWYPAQLALLLEESLPLSEVLPLLRQALSSAKTKALAWRFLTEHFSELKSRLPAGQATRLITIADNLCEHGDADRLRTFFGPRIGGIEGGETKLQQTIEQIELCVAYERFHRPSLERFLAGL